MHSMVSLDYDFWNVLLVSNFLEGRNWSFLYRFPSAYIFWHTVPETWKILVKLLNVLSSQHFLLNCCYWCLLWTPTWFLNDRLYLASASEVSLYWPDIFFSQRHLFQLLLCIRHNSMSRSTAGRKVRDVGAWAPRFLLSKSPKGRCDSS